MQDGKVDIPVFSKMVDLFLQEGFNYFDTAHGYLGGQSEAAIKEALTSRYPRDKYLLTDKLTDGFFKSEEEILPLFESQLMACGVEYFDFYLMHAQNAQNYEKFKKCRAYETAFELKRQGRVRHVGISFHDKPEVLRKILTEYPQIEIVQIQLNYVDYEDPAVQSRRCYEVCREFHKPVIVMEPAKGGSLISLPEESQRIFDGLKGGSNASYAIRFAASFEGIEMVLSGMGSMEMMEENTSFMKDFVPLSEDEMEAVRKVADIFNGQGLIPCTACHYCTDGCPKKIPIPDIFACLNAKRKFRDWNADFYYGVHTRRAGKAGDCIRCGKCERECPQHLEIRQLLQEAAREFEGR